MFSVCLPSDALLQHLPSYLDFSYLGRGVSLHGIREIQIKTTMRCHLTPVRMAVIEKTRAKCWQEYREKENLVHGGCCCPVTQSCSVLCDPMDCSTPVFPVLHYLLEFAQTHVHWVSDAIHPSHPLLPFFSSCLQSFFPMSCLFTLCGQSIWSFSFSISPSNEYSELISFRIDWFDLLAIQGTLKSWAQ